MAATTRGSPTDPAIAERITITGYRHSKDCPTSKLLTSLLTIILRFYFHQKLEELNKYPDFNNYLIFVLTKLTSEGKFLNALPSVS